MFNELNWDTQTQEKFKALLAKLPLFHRKMAESMVSEKANELAIARGVSLIGEEDLVKALFTEVPKVFLDQMLGLLKEVGIDYEKYKP